MATEALDPNLYTFGEGEHRTQYEITERLGQGATKAAFKARRVHPPCPNNDCFVVLGLCLKDVHCQPNDINSKLSTITDTHKGNFFLRHEVLSQANGPYGLTNLWIAEYNPAMGTDLDSHVNLRGILNGAPAPENVVRQRLRALRVIGQQLHFGADDLASKAMYHGDLKAANFFLRGKESFSVEDIIDGKVSIVIGDYGEMQDFGLTKVRSMITGTPSTMPPEAYRLKSLINPKSDTFSVAASLYNYLTGDIIQRAHPRLGGDPQLIHQLAYFNGDKKFHEVQKIYAEIQAGVEEVLGKIEEALEKKVYTSEALKKQVMDDFKALKAYIVQGLSPIASERPKKFPTPEYDPDYFTNSQKNAKFARDVLPTQIPAPGQPPIDQALEHAVTSLCDMAQP